MFFIILLYNRLISHPARFKTTGDIVTSRIHQDSFVKRVMDCCSNLKFKRTTHTHSRPNMTTFQRAEKFISDVVQVFSRHLKKMTQNSKTNLERIAQLETQNNSLTSPFDSSFSEGPSIKAQNTVAARIGKGISQKTKDKATPTRIVDSSNKRGTNTKRRW